MYKKGSLEFGKTMDSARDYEDVTGAYLPHSCDTWVIGGRKEIEDLIVDLTNLLNRIPK